ncbi:MAG: hypothetical protein WCE68_03840 [Anaerolineales bacterium]
MTSENRDPLASQPAVPARKPYTKPHLAALGDLRTLTLGNSPTGFPDSGVGTKMENIFPNSAPGFPTPGIPKPHIPKP